MAAGSRSLTRSDSKQLNALENDQVDQNTRVSSRYSSPAFILLLLGLLLVPAPSQSQTAKASNVPSQRYTVSAAQLRAGPKVAAYLSAAHKQFSAGNLARAERELERAIQIDPSCGPAFSMRAFIDLAGNKPVNAISDATRAVEIDAQDSESFVAMAMAYNALKKFSAADEAARYALAIHPDSWQGRLELAKSSYGLGQLEPALEELDAVGKDFPDVHLVRANVLMKLGRLGEAAKEFKVFMEKEPRDPRNEQIRRILQSHASFSAAADSPL